jgi:hypothetical protein
MQLPRISWGQSLLRFSLAGLLLDGSTRSHGPWNMVFALLALWPLITAWIGLCPLYYFHQALGSRMIAHVEDFNYPSK